MDCGLNQSWRHFPHFPDFPSERRDYLVGHPSHDQRSASIPFNLHGISPTKTLKSPWKEMPFTDEFSAVHLGDFPFIFTL